MTEQLSNRLRGGPKWRVVLAIYLVAIASALTGLEGGSVSYWHGQSVDKRSALGSANLRSNASLDGMPNREDSPSDFQGRCSNPGVIRCVGFDSPADIAGTYGDVSGIMSGATRPSLDTVIKASGNSSLRFTVPPRSAADTSGSYFTNFSTDLKAQFGENSDFYIQWRQRFSPEFLNTKYLGGEGWKQVIIGSGDQAGHPYASCTALEIVLQNTYQRGLAGLYNSCTGSSSHGGYDPFEEPFGSANFKLQNAMPAPYCLYSQAHTSPPTTFPPTGNCFPYYPNEWMTFQIHVRTGPRANDEFTNSFVRLWIAREGRPSKLVFNWGPYKLSAGNPAENQRFGKIWLLPYHTGKDPNQVYETGYVWYDELIVSRQAIPDPK
jgi:hypothetical protein